MASFIDSLKQMSFDQLVHADHLSMVREGHWTLPISAVVIVMGVLFFLIGVGTWTRSKLKSGMFFAVLGALVGWGSAYLSHTQTASAATTAPAATGATNEVAYAAIAPTAAAIAVMLLCGLAMLVVKEKKDGKGGPPKGH